MSDRATKKQKPPTPEGTKGGNRTPSTDKSTSREDQVRVTLSRALERPEFATGLRYGLSAVALGFVAATVWRLARGRAAPIAGLVFAAAAVLALRDVTGVPDRLVLGVAVLAGATFAAEMFRLPPAVEILAAIPGAVLVALAVPDPATDWVRVLVMMVTVIGGAAAGGFDHRWRRRGGGPVLAAITIAGIYACVPETKHALVLLGVTSPSPCWAGPWR